MKLLYIHIISPEKDTANVVQVLQMCYAFQKNGIELTLAVPLLKGSTTEKARAAVAKKLGKKIDFQVITYSCPTILGKGAEIGAYWGVKQLLKTYTDFEVCFVRSIALNKLLISKSIPTVYESHSEKLHSISFLQKMYERWLIQATQAKNQLFFISISKALGEVWKKRGVPESKIKVLHDGFSEEDFAQIQTQIQAQSELNLANDKKIVLYSGSLYKNRNIPTILKLAEAVEQADFYILGGSPEQCQYYKNMAKEQGLKNVYFLGQVPHYQVKNYLYAANVLLMIWSWDVPTIHICSPLKVFEYMAAGRVIVGQEFPTIKEVLTDGENALLAHPDSFEQLKSKLQTALNEELNSPIAENARQLAFEKYSWEKRTQAIIDNIKKLLSF